MNELTARQQEVLRVIRDYSAKHQFMPAVLPTGMGKIKGKHCHLPSVHANNLSERHPLEDRK